MATTRPASRQDGPNTQDDPALTWATTWDAKWMLAQVYNWQEARKHRLFACACYLTLEGQPRQTHVHLMNQAAALIAAGDYGYGAEATAAAEAAADHSRPWYKLSQDAYLVRAWFALTDPRLAAYSSAEVFGNKNQAVASLVGEVWGNPFLLRPDGVFGLVKYAGTYQDVTGKREVEYTPVLSYRHWRTDLVVRLAREAQVERHPTELCVLADALEDAGCDLPAMLEHLRGPGPHVLGCWVLDYLLYSPPGC